MAMEVLRCLCDTIPHWQRRLADLGGQFEHRQAQLSTIDALETDLTAFQSSAHNRNLSQSLKLEGDFRKECSEPLARARKRRLSYSPASAEVATAIFEGNKMVAVYYDSYVQGFFDDLVRFVSSSRNLLRRAKLAAKIALVKRLAEIETADDAIWSAVEPFAADALLPRRYKSSNALAFLNNGRRPEGPKSSRDSKELLNIHDFLDQSLELVQSRCEYSADRFLRDANCSDEIGKIQTLLADALQAINKEIKWVHDEGIITAEEVGDLYKPRAHCHIKVRRGMLGLAPDYCTLNTKPSLFSN